MNNNKIKNTILYAVLVSAFLILFIHCAEERNEFTCSAETLSGEAVDISRDAKYEYISGYNIFTNVSGDIADGTFGINWTAKNEDGNPICSDELVEQTLGLADNCFVYKLKAPLFTDYACKYRTVCLPEGTQIQYDGTCTVGFPLGTVITKTFYYISYEDNISREERLNLIETRVLVRNPDDWEHLAYEWRGIGDEGEEITITLDKHDALRAISARFPSMINFISEDGENRSTTKYTIPNINQCLECHQRLTTFQGVDGFDKASDIVGTGLATASPLGPEIIQWNFDIPNPDDSSSMINQVRYLESKGFIIGVPNILPTDGLVDYTDINQTAEDRSRSYLHANCGIACHRPDHVTGQQSKLFLNIETPVGFNYGICKEPGSAGSGGDPGEVYDILPGNAFQSILYTRSFERYEGAETGLSGAMPPLARSLRDDFSFTFVASWLNDLPENNACN